MNEVTIKGEVKFVDEVREYETNSSKAGSLWKPATEDNPIAEFTKDNIEKSQGPRATGHHRSPGQWPRMDRSRRSYQNFKLHRRLQGGNRRWFGGGPRCSPANRPRQFFFRYLRRIRRRGGRRRFLKPPILLPRARFGPGHEGRRSDALHRLRRHRPQPGLDRKEGMLRQPNEPSLAKGAPSPTSTDPSMNKPARFLLPFLSSCLRTGDCRTADGQPDRSRSVRANWKKSTPRWKNSSRRTCRGGSWSLPAKERSPISNPMARRPRSQAPMEKDTLSHLLHDQSHHLGRRPELRGRQARVERSAFEVLPEPQGPKGPHPKRIISPK